ncbi:MAG TPA: hypothetical protein VFK82_04325, partial [Burkholderiaceae bacterium]|nr:hypothetical protein [Burkholderiaceae bacterium]
MALTRPAPAATAPATAIATLTSRAPVLPDACNYGIALRLLLAVNAVVLVATLPGSVSASAWFERFVERAAVLEPAALLSIVLCCGLRKLAAREPRWL